MSSDTSTPTNTGQFIAAIKISAFADVDSFKRDVDKLAAELRAHHIGEPSPGLAASGYLAFTTLEALLSVDREYSGARQPPSITRRSHA